jgi:hypothetical protein
VCADKEGLEESGSSSISGYVSLENYAKRRTFLTRRRTVCYGQRPFMSSETQSEVEHEFPTDSPSKAASPRDGFPAAQSSKAAESKPQPK